MIQAEKERLLAFFNEPGKWCQSIDATDAGGSPVLYDDASAVSWDLVSGLFRLFGEKRGCQLCETIARHVSKGNRSVRRVAFDLRDPETMALATLLDFNDADGMSYDLFIAALRSLPVWNGRRSADSALFANEG